MGPANVIASVCLLCLGGIIVGTGLWCLDRRDHLRIEAARQGRCGWHRWRALDDGVWLVCDLCGKKSRKLNPLEDRAAETAPSEHIFP